MSKTKEVQIDDLNVSFDSDELFDTNLVKQIEEEFNENDIFLAHDNSFNQAIESNDSTKNSILLRRE